MYCYQMIEELELRSENVFTLKASTLYPILHTLRWLNPLTSCEPVKDHANTIG